LHSHFFLFVFVSFICLLHRCILQSLPTGPRSILFREFLPIMKPLLDELRDIARQRKKSVAQVKNNLTFLGYRIPSPSSSSSLVLPIPSCSGDGIYIYHTFASKQVSHFLPLCPYTRLPVYLSSFFQFRFHVKYGVRLHSTGTYRKDFLC
jgi:hypothetical protein